MAQIAWFDYQMVPTGRGPEIKMTWPVRCPNGHGLVGTQCRVGYGQAPDLVMRRSWTCVECDAIVWGD